MNLLYRSTFALAIAASAVTVQAQTATGQFEVRLSIEEACSIQTQEMDFGAAGLLTQDIETSSTITVHCTNTTPFSVALDQGSNGERRMVSNGDSIGYGLYSDASFQTPWGDDTNAVNGLGDGEPQQLTVYGIVRAQPSAAPGDYFDLVTATVTF
jgi:spore coat protein U-like protein